ncbi:hypothetical protein BJX63DRAFT_384542 [Aspergillus granulosus]|uniref:Uncharacterized protein n=1 Tax=Aspergillus granulosus TaxID=176169 RepID=A0ABR4HSG3_9EURO
MYIPYYIHQTMRLITVNILTDLPTQDLYAPRYTDLTDETEFQLQTRLTLVNDICSILEVLATAPIIAALNITWLDQRQQALLRSAIESGTLNKPYVNRFLMATWHDILEARRGRRGLEYEIPPIKIIVGKQTFPDEAKPGHHHLGILYPFNEELVQNEVFLAPRNGWRCYPKPQQGSVRTSASRSSRIYRLSRIYPQPIIESPDGQQDETWKVFPKIFFPDLHALIRQLLSNLVNILS